MPSLVLCALCCAWGAAVAFAEPDWCVSVEGRPIPLRHVDISIRENNEPADHLRLKGVWYQYGTFGWRRPVCVRVSCRRTLGKLEILPREAAPDCRQVSSNAVEFTATHPFKLSFRPEGRVGVLHLFGEAPDPRLPKPDGKGVIHFGPGEHEMRSIRVRSNETLLVDEGAVVYGHLDVRGTNVTVCGAGILSGARFERFRGPGQTSFSVVDATNVSIRGVTFTDPYGWCVGICRSKGVTLENVKVMGGRMINDDGIDIINSSDVTIRNSFIRTQDDNIAVKGLDYTTEGTPMLPVENLLVERCQLWTDQANNIRIGFECDAAWMRQLRFVDLDVLASSPLPTDPDAFWSHAVMKVQASGGLAIADVELRNVRVNAEDSMASFVALASAFTWSRRPGIGRYKYAAGGTVRNCRISTAEIRGLGERPGGWIQVEGRTPRENVDHVTLEDVRIDGHKLSPSDSRLRLRGSPTSIFVR